MTYASAVFEKATNGQFAATARERGTCNSSLRRSEREAILNGDHSWVCCGTHVGPSIVRRNDIKPLQTDVKDADIGTGNDNEEVAPNLEGNPVPNASEK